MGPEGPQGLQGATGPTGPQGPQGIAVLTARLGRLVLSGLLVPTGATRPIGPANSLTA